MADQVTGSSRKRQPSMAARLAEKCLIRSEIGSEGQKEMAHISEMAWQPKSAIERRRGAVDGIA